MTALSIRRFGGMVPRATKRDLPDDKMQVAIDLVADSDEFRPLLADSASTPVTGMPAGATVRTLYRHPTNSSTLKGTDLSLSFVRSQIADDPYDRVYVSTVKNEGEYQPRVLTSTVTSPETSVEFLGVNYPTSAVTLAISTASGVLLSHGDADGFKNSMLAKIKSIVHSALEPVLWNPSFDLDGKAGFRVKDSVTGLYQRYWVLNNPGGTVPSWDTVNGTPVANHLWLIAVSNPASVLNGAKREYYADFSAKVLTWCVKPEADVTTQTTALRALKLNADSEPLLTEANVTALWTALRAVIPNDPEATPSTELKTLLAKFKSEYTTLVNYLDQGFAVPDVTPQSAMQTVAKAGADLQATAGAITTYYDTLAGKTFDDAVTSYLQESNFQSVLPAGETPVEELRYYTWTLVNGRKEESKPYLPGDGNADEDMPSITVNQLQKVTVTRPSVTGDATHWRLYRSAMGATAASFQFVAEMPIATATYTDDRATTALGEGLMTTGWFPPPVHSGPKYLRHLVGMPNGFLAGFVENTVYFSEPNHPYAWPVTYAIPCQSPVIALGVFGVTLVVFTESGVSYISGTHPDEMSKVDIETSEVCVSPRSVTPVTGGVVFASYNGLCLASQSGITNLTSGLYVVEDWRKFDIASIICDEYGGVIYMTDRVLSGYKLTAALHVPSGKLTTVTLNASAFYSDLADGKFYAAEFPVGGTAAKYVRLFDGATPRTTAFVRSKRIVLPKETGFAWMSVEGEQSAAKPLNLDIFGYYVSSDGVEVEVKLKTALAATGYSAVVKDTRPFRIEPGRYKDFEFAMSGACRITAVTVVSTLDELQEIA